MRMDTVFCLQPEPPCIAHTWWRPNYMGPIDHFTCVAFSKTPSNDRTIWLFWKIIIRVMMYNTASWINIYLEDKICASEVVSLAEIETESPPRNPSLLFIVRHLLIARGAVVINHFHNPLWWSVWRGGAYKYREKRNDNYTALRFIRYIIFV